MKINLEGIKIRTISCAVPEDVLRISSLSELLGEKEINRIIMNSGIESLHLADTGTTSADLCETAARAIFESTELTPDLLDGIIFISQTPDYILPPTSNVLQHRLGMSSSSFTMDVNHGCSGYIYGLFLGSLLISSNSCSNVLVLAGDTISKVVNPKDRSLRSIMGDCGSATIIEKGNDNISFNFLNDGSRFDSLIIPSGGFRKPVNKTSHKVTKRENDNWRSDEDVFMNGLEIMKFALSDVTEFVKETLNQMAFPKDKIDLFVFHQANRFIIDSIAKVLDLPPDKTPVTVKNFGNTSSASIPLALVDWKSKNNSTEYSRILLVGFGVGLSCGIALVNLDETGFLPLSILKTKKGAEEK